jgi:polysaccharide biosynthesis/export protein
MMGANRTGEARLGRPTALAIWVGVVLLGGGCHAYDATEIQQFLQMPRRPVSGVEYRVYPPDSISIRSLTVSEINANRQQVRPDGKINLPLLGEVFIAGMTPAEIEDVLVEAAEEYYEEADATVDISRYSSQSYYVMGQVGREGPYPWTGRDTVLDALATARPNNLAWTERIVVVRGSEPQVGGWYAPSRDYASSGIHEPSKEDPPQKMTINLLAMIEHGDLANNILLMPNDVIYVQPTPLAKIGLAIQRLLFPIRPALEAASVPARAIP